MLIVAKSLTSYKFDRSHTDVLRNINIIYTGCNRRNGPDFGRMFLMLNYTEKLQDPYIQSSMVTEI